MLQNNDLLIVLTARLGSERLPRKALLPIAGKPLISWIIERLRGLGYVVLETSDSLDDADLWQLAKRLDVPLIKDTGGDIVTCMNNAIGRYMPNAKYILRGLGDAPFFAVELQKRMLDALEFTQKDIFYWFLPPYSWPLYGSRESPYSRVGWEKVNRQSTMRNTPDQLFHTRRDLFDICYHVPPRNVYFRDYRLEVDWQEDFELVKSIGEDGPGMLAPVKNIVEYLDTHHEIAMLNHTRRERTGPSTFDHQTQRTWVKQMLDTEVLDWNNSIWKSSSNKAQPIFCKSGRCFLGWGDDGILFTRDGSRITAGYIACNCPGNTGLVWNKG